MVFIHGGGFVQGSSRDPLYDGANLARAGDLVVVTMNYRLGGLGFLATEALAAESSEDSAGNYGSRDQIAALSWVGRNVAAFGGDPDEVTVFGESAGGSSICVLLGSPRADGLFGRAIQQSGGGCYAYPDLREAGRLPSAIESSRGVVAATGCDRVADELACLRGLDASEIVDATLVGAGTSVFGLPGIGPNVDGDVLPGLPFDRMLAGDVPDVPFIAGSNADEMALFAMDMTVPTAAAYERIVREALGDTVVADRVLELYPADAFRTPKAAYIAVSSDIIFICPALSVARAMASGSEPAFAYHFTHALGGVLGLLGAAHGLELPFIFANYSQWDYTPTEADLRVVDAMQGAWTSFARGEPAPVTDPAWPVYTEAEPAIALLDDPIAIADEIREGRCEELRSLGLVL